MTDVQDEERDPSDEIRKALSSIGWLDGPADVVVRWCAQRWRIDRAPDASAEAIRHLSEKYLERLEDFETLHQEQQDELEAFCQATNDRLEEIKKLRELEALYREVAHRIGPYLWTHGMPNGSDEEIARGARLRAELGIET